MPTMIETRRLMTAVAAALVAAACGGSPTMPTRPPFPPGEWTPAPPPAPPTPLAVVTGTVYEHSPAGPVAIAGIALEVSEVGPSRGANVVSDADGRYRLEIFHPQHLKATVMQPGWSQPCRASGVFAEDGTLDIHLLRTPIQSIADLPATLPAPGPTLSGVVFERTQAGLLPTPGVEVILDYVDGGWFSDIGGRFVTDAHGRYFFCGLKEEEAGRPVDLYLWTDPPGYERVVLQVGGPGVVDIEIVRR